MRDVSLHLLDIAQNSIRAGAKLVTLRITLDGEGLMTVTVRDDGTGMDAETARRVQDPFVTSRTERKVGLGLPLLKDNAEKTGGSLMVASMPGQGTAVTAIFRADHIDCIPLGDLPGTVLTLVTACPEKPDFDFCMTTPRGEASLDTREIRKALSGVPVNTPEVIAWMASSLKDEIEQITGGTDHEIHR